MAKNGELYRRRNLTLGEVLQLHSELTTVLSAFVDSAAHAAPINSTWAGALLGCVTAQFVRLVRTMRGYLAFLALLVGCGGSVDSGAAAGAGGLGAGVGGAPSVVSPTGTGGATSTAGALGAGCTGNLETVQSTTGLCIATMVPITGPMTNQDYTIDETEVTQGQYAVWLATNPAPPASTDANCGYVTSYGGYTDSGDGYAVTDAGYAGTDASHHPVATVDWGDAYAYCKGVGKRLCGAIGGGANPVDSRNNDYASQWYRACSSGGMYAYPYGYLYQSNYCATYDNTKGQTVAVGSLPNCVTSTMGYVGVYDLSGNVYEWEDSCTGNGPSAFCELRGGSIYNDTSSILACAAGVPNITRNAVNINIGFRCCSP